jgi:RNA polymerase sigma-70 factor, Bacteroides expansion family 1
MKTTKAVPYIDDLKEDFDKIYLLYFSRLHRFAKEYVLNDEDAENIVQDVFMQLWEKRDVLNVQVNLASYLFSLVKNRCLDYLRHKIVIEEYQKTLSLKLIALEQFDYNHSSEDEIELVVTNAIDKLPERCREIFVKSRLEGKKYKEIAEDLSLSVSTIETQMGIALKKLRVELKDYLLLLVFLISG